MAGRKICDERDVRLCLAAAKTAGMNRTQWARRNGVDGRSLFAWAKKLERGETAQGTAKTGRRKKQGGMVELIPQARCGEGHYVIRFGQIAVEIDERFDESTLMRLLTVILAC